MKKRIYFDNAASAPLDKDVCKLLKKYARNRIKGNPSSLYQEGRIAKNMIEQARRECACALGCLPEEIFFTSGASESNSWAHKIWNLQPNIRTHDSLYKDCSWEEDIVIATSFLNNETGEFDIDEYDNDQPLFVDLTSAIGHTHINLKNRSNIVGASLSGHKIGALQGVGLLYIRKDQHIKLDKTTRLIQGHQEDGMRGGTENTLGIISLGIAMKNCDKKLKRYHSHTQQQASAIYWGAGMYGLQARASHHIINITFNYLDAQTAVMIFDRYGIAVSAGSACNSDTDKPSKILLSSGYTNYEALRTIRVSLGEFTTFRECRKFVRVLRKIVDKYDVL